MSARPPPLHNATGGGDPAVDRSFTGVYGNVFNIAVGLLVLSLLAVVGFAVHKRMRAIAVVPVFVFYLGVMDFIGDATFVAVIPDTTPALARIRQLAIAFFACSSAANLVILLVFFGWLVYRGGEKNAPFVRWLRKHQGTFWGLMALSLSGARMMTLVHSRMFDIDKFTAPLTMRAIDALDLIGMVTVLLEDVPQLVLTVLVTNWTETWDSVAYSSLGLNAASIALGVACRVLTYQNLRDADRSGSHDVVPAEFHKTHDVYLKGHSKRWRYFSGASSSEWTPQDAAGSAMLDAAANVSAGVACPAAVAILTEYVNARGDLERRNPVLFAALQATAGVGGDVAAALTQAHAAAALRATAAVGTTAPPGHSGGSGGGGVASKVASEPRAVAAAAVDGVASVVRGSGSGSAPPVGPPPPLALKPGRRQPRRGSKADARFGSVLATAGAGTMSLANIRAARGRGGPSAGLLLQPHELYAVVTSELALSDDVYGATSDDVLYGAAGSGTGLSAHAPAVASPVPLGLSGVTLAVAFPRGGVASGPREGGGTPRPTVDASAAAAVTPWQAPHTPWSPAPSPGGGDGGSSVSARRLPMTPFDPRFDITAPAPPQQPTPRQLRVQLQRQLLQQHTQHSAANVHRASSQLDALEQSRTHSALHSSARSGHLADWDARVAGPPPPPSVPGNDACPPPLPPRRGRTALGGHALAELPDGGSVTPQDDGDAATASDGSLGEGSVGGLLSGDVPSQPDALGVLMALRTARASGGGAATAAVAATAAGGAAGRRPARAERVPSSAERAGAVASAGVGESGSTPGLRQGAPPLPAQPAPWVAGEPQQAARALEPPQHSGEGAHALEPPPLRPLPAAAVAAGGVASAWQPQLPPPARAAAGPPLLPPAPAAAASRGAPAAPVLPVAAVAVPNVLRAAASMREGAPSGQFASAASSVPPAAAIGSGGGGGGGGGGSTGPPARPPRAVVTVTRGSHRGVEPPPAPWAGRQQ